MYGISILDRKELQVHFFFIKWLISVPEDCFWQAGPGEIPPNVAFHPSLHCLHKYLFTGIQNDCFVCLC